MTRYPAVLGFVALFVAGCVTVNQPNPSAPPASTQGPAQAATPPPAATAQRYVIRSGDNLHAIARQFGLTIGQLLAANPSITDPNRIRVGQTLVIPPPDAPDTGPESAAISDASEDAVGPDGQLITSQGYADLRGVQATLAANGRLQIDIKLLNHPPARLDPAIEVLTYTVVIDTTADGQPDFKVIYGNDIDGQNGFAASLEDRRSGQIDSGASFPGTVSVKGSTLTFLIRRTALGAPRSYALAATVEREYHPGGADDPEVEDSVDNAPDQQWPRPNPRWLEVGGV